MESTFIFDSKLTTYENLSELNRQKIRFITLRRRGHKLVLETKKLEPWRRITIPHDKRKYPQPMVHESTTELRGYDGDVRQIIVRGNGRDKPTFLITNDFEMPVELLVGNYARRWRVENCIAEAVKFFRLDALSSPILIKIHFEVIMTMIADTLYCGPLPGRTCRSRYLGRTGRISLSSSVERDWCILIIVTIKAGAKIGVHRLSPWTIAQFLNSISLAPSNLTRPCLHSLYRAPRRPSNN